VEQQGRGCSGRDDELCACYPPPRAVELHACATEPVSIHDGCSSKQARGALCDAAPLVSCLRRCRTGKLRSTSSSAMTSIHPPKQQGDIVLQPHIASVCFRCFNYLT
jgi:hypothetical protein